VQIVPRATQPVKTIIGTSVEGRSIEAYLFTESSEDVVANVPSDSAQGNKHFVFIGGIHGGYEWNSVALAYRSLAHLTANQSLIPSGTAITIIPNLNPDAVYKVLGLTDMFTEADAQRALRTRKVTEEDLASARFNANNVDLNRNFACAWQPKATWKGTQVSAGKDAFSEPESRALKSFVEQLLERHSPEDITFVFWHSKANAVYASRCGDGDILPGTLSALHSYGTASKYTQIESFDAYPVTGAAEDWLASIGIPAITVELSSHTSLDWAQNVAGLTALIQRGRSTLRE
jgi:predicted deacylase